MNSGPQKMRYPVRLPPLQCRPPCTGAYIAQMMLGLRPLTYLGDHDVTQTKTSHNITTNHELTHTQPFIPYKQSLIMTPTDIM